MKSNKIIKIEYGIIGGGLAGCAAALELAQAGKKVEMFVKNKLLENSNSYLLAGGLAGISQLQIKKGDSFEAHIKETLKAGKYLNDKEVVKFYIEHFYPDVIDWLMKKGVKFDKSKTGFDLHKEGGHSENRVYHIKDTTGRSIMDILTKKVNEHPNINIHEDHIAIDLITENKPLGGKRTCCGFYIFDIKNNHVKTIQCEGTFIATGGIGKVFSYTTNSDVASGDGFAMCYRAGLPLANMEFVQFHPTVYYDPTASDESERRFLFTEALRGGGAILKNSKSTKKDFVLKYNSLGSRATRDIVTRAEDLEMRKLGLNHLWLDCSKISKEKLKNSFKNAYDFCLEKGIDLSKEPVPVVYAEHYSNGGVLTGKNGETKIERCYVIGETAYTGLHGATRLASNSGPECILSGRLAAKHALTLNKAENIDISTWNTGKAIESKDKVTISYYWEIIRRTMNALCGMSRNEERLQAAKEVINSLKESINKFYWNYLLDKNFLEVRNIAEVADIIIQSALFRKESRGCHFREDFPKEKKEFEGITLIEKRDKLLTLENIK